MTKDFRPSRAAVLGKEAPLLLLLLGIAALLSFLREPGWVFLGGLSAVVGALLVHRSVLPVWRSRIRLDDSALTGRLDSRDFRFEWPDVVVARVDTESGGSVLTIASADAFVRIPLEHYPSGEIWAEVEGRVPPQALSADAHEGLPAFQDWDRRRRAFVDDGEAVETQDAQWTRVVAWGGSAAFAVLAVGAAAVGEWGATIIFGGFALVSAIFGVHVGETAVTPEGVRRRNVLGVYGIRWQEVTLVEISPYGDGIALHGRSQCLSIPGPIYWSSSSREAAFESFMAYVDLHELPTKDTWRAAARLSRGTRIPRNRRLGSRAPTPRG